MAALWKVVGSLAFTISMSATMIIFNAMLLRSFRHPVWLTCWHQSVSTICVCVVRCLCPSWVTVRADDQPPMTMLQGLRLGAPIAAMQCLGLIAGNTAVMYLSVGFCQMIKAWTASVVYMVGCFWGTQRWSLAVAKTLLIITGGLMVTSIGELKFNLYGFAMQLVALFSEAMRINLVETRLKSAGLQLNPLSSVLLTAPVASLLLCGIGLATDREISLATLQAVGELKLLANGLIAFLLNVAIFLAISVCSGLIYSLAGIVKDISIITGSVFIMGSTVAPMQILGYSIALSGIQTYGVVSKEPQKFEAGLVKGIYLHVLGTAPSHRVAPYILGADVESWEKKSLKKEEVETSETHLPEDLEGQDHSSTSNSSNSSTKRHIMVQDDL